LSSYAIQPGNIAEDKSGNQPWCEGIAIVGMSARFPGCRSVDEYWTRLAAGESLLSQATDEEVRASGIDPMLADAMHFVRSGTRLEDAESFDAKFFDLSRREAEIMDPQQRIFLECAYEALEHAGITGAGERTGVFAGIGMNTYMMQLLGNPEMLAAAGGYQMMLANDKDFVATRAAYKLNLRGPAVVVQTACSTSLAAVHLACMSLLAGECDSALAGGVSVTFPQVAGYQYVPGMILSPDGLCRPFDESARGTVPGRGAGLVVLKRLSDAEAAGDKVYAVIAGSAWNNDGSSKVGYTAPSVEGQVEVIRAAQRAAGASVDRFGYVEAHGTGTELGDPIEVAALAEVFSRRSEDAAKCVLGSVKANMGHADVAAGVAGLIKATLAVYHGVIPPTPHFERANPALRIDQTPFLVSAEEQPWPRLAERQAGERWAGVSSFGIGGTNVHLCLRSVVSAPKSGGETGPWIFPLSAKTAGALEASTARLAEFAWGNTELNLAGAATTLQVGRRAYLHRRAVVAGGREELIAALRVPKKDGEAEKGANPVVFLFPGQGQQFAGMAAALYERDARFRERIDKGLALLPARLAELLLTAICRGEETDEAMGTSVAQPLLFLVGYALAARWIELGVAPKALLGHSLGELTAATVAGVFSFEDGLHLAVERGALMEASPEGAMLAVSLAVDAVGPYLTPELWIAAENGPKLTVISGACGAVREAEEKLMAVRVATIRLKTDRAFHTPHMAEVATRFHRAVAAVERHVPRLPWLSNVTGTWITPEEAMSPQYWADQITSRVRFAENGSILAPAGIRSKHFLLEVGPGDALIGLVRQQDKRVPAASSLGGPNRHGNDFEAFLKAAAALWEHGTNLRWEKLSEGSDARPRKVALPTYPFERERFWAAASALPGLSGLSIPDSQSRSESGVSLVKNNDVASWFYVPTWQRTPPAALVLAGPREAIATWVVAGDFNSLSAEWCLPDLLAARLEQDGTRVLRLSLTGASRETLEAFWNEHRDGTAGPWGLVDCRMAGGAVTGSEVPDEGYASLMLLLQTAGRARVRFAQVELVAPGLAEVQSERVEDSRRAIVEGLVRMLPAEYAELRARVIDPGLEWRFDGDAASVVEMIVAEMATVGPHGLTAAIRDHTRWQQEWLQVPLGVAKRLRFRQRGTYVITGGLGGVGYLMARRLLKEYQATVILLGRTVLPHRERWEEWLTEHGPVEATSMRILRAKELEVLPGELLLLAADVADRTSMAEAWKTIESRFGAVHGVIHAAGLTSNERITAQSAASVEAVLRPKVQGSEVLAGLMAGKEADFLVFCSSISAIHPAPGAAAYAAANAFQDRYAIWCRQRLGLPAISINLDTLRDVGMAAELYTPAEFEDVKQALMTKAMTPEECVDAIERALGSGEPRILISTFDLQSVFSDTAARLYPQNTASRNAASGDSLGEAGATEETQAVMAIWREVLGAETIGPSDNFFELGGHSLLGTMVLARIRERFGVELTIRVIFEAPTPKSLASRICEGRLAPPEAQSVGGAGEREDFEF